MLKPLNYEASIIHIYHLAKTLICQLGTEIYMSMNVHIVAIYMDQSLRQFTTYNILYTS